MIQPQEALLFVTNRLQQFRRSFESAHAATSAPAYQPYVGRFNVLGPDGDITHSRKYLSEVFRLALHSATANADSH